MFSEIEIPDLERLKNNLEASKLAGPALRNFGERIGITVQSEARALAPVDSGLLRSSIGYEVDSAPFPLWVKVGTSIFYAPAQEFGTGSLSDGEQAKGGIHWPPADALEIWARRHGFESGRQVARIIGRRGGLRPKRFMRGGLENSMKAISRFLVMLGDEIERRWSER